MYCFIFQIIELIECCGGSSTGDAVSDANNAILVPCRKSWKVDELRTYIKQLSGIRCWSVKKCDKTVLADDLYRLQRCENEVFLYLLRYDWLVDSISAGSLLDLNRKYCCGVLHIEFNNKR